MMENLKDENIYGIPGFPTRESAKKANFENVYSDHVPQLVSTGDIQILTWNVYDGGPIFGYNIQNEDFLRKEEKERVKLFRIFSILENCNDNSEFENKLLDLQSSDVDLYNEVMVIIQKPISGGEEVKEAEEINLQRKEVYHQLQELKKENQQLTNKAVEDRDNWEIKRQTRVSQAIKKTINNNTNISILTFQEMSDGLRIMLFNELGPSWDFTVERDTTTFYRRDVWDKVGEPKSLEDNKGVTRGHQIFLKNKKTSQNIALSNVHLDGSGDAFEKNLDLTMDALSPLSTDNTLRIIVGDFNTPLRLITTQEDVTSLCPQQFSGRWVLGNMSKEVIHDLDGGFACQNHELIPCTIKTLDVKTGQVIEENQEVSFDYEPKEEKYLEESIKEKIDNLSVVFSLSETNYKFEKKVLGVDLFDYACQRFIKQGKQEYFHAPFSFWFGGYSIYEKAQALELFTLYLKYQDKNLGVAAKILSEDQFNKYIDNIHNMPRILGALNNGNLCKCINKAHSVQLNEINELIQCIESQKTRQSKI